MTNAGWWGRARRWGPEATLAVLASAMFLGFLGSVDLWGKREQRASAEALDTVDHDHWLIARIQGRTRLEKPPLPRWTVAALMKLTGRRDEAIVRLPAALSALGTIALIYGLGRRLGGRQVGLASGYVLTSCGFFIGEMRQAGNDGPLAFLTTLALYAAWRRLHGGSADRAEGVEPGARVWSILMYAALGLGFLTKGPVILILVGLAVVPYLAAAGRLWAGLGALADGRGLLLFLLLALSWPAPVLMKDPAAARVWYIEMAQKAGTVNIAHHRHHHVLAAEWPGMTAPWTLILAAAILLPFRAPGRRLRPAIWFPWWWAVGNLGMFCLWEVAKPNYYLPCLPGAALLAGIEWVHLTRAARAAGSASGSGSAWARAILQSHWVALFTVAVAAPVVVAQREPTYLGWACALAAALAGGVVLGVWAWRRGAEAGALAPLVAALAVGVLAGYGAIGPAAIATQSHRTLAATLDRLLPADVHTIMFYRELDEGLWFYLRDRTLRAIPGSQPVYNEGFDMAEEARTGRVIWSPTARLALEERTLLDWLRRPNHESPYVLIRARTYDQFARDLVGLATPVYREPPLGRHELILLRVTAPAMTPVASRE